MSKQRTNMNPVCLPTFDMWRDKFSFRATKVSGYGRKDSIANPHEDQTSCQLMDINMFVIDNGKENCKRVICFRYYSPLLTTNH